MQTLVISIGLLIIGFLLGQSAVAQQSSGASEEATKRLPQNSKGGPRRFMETDPDG